MPHCFRRKFAFIHIPKTGGSSIEFLLDLTHKENFFEVDPKAYHFEGVDYAPQHLTIDLLSGLVPGFDDLMT